MRREAPRGKVTALVLLVLVGLASPPLRAAPHPDLHAADESFRGLLVGGAARGVIYLELPLSADPRLSSLSLAFNHREW